MKKKSLKYLLNKNLNLLFHIRHDVREFHDLAHETHFTRCRIKFTDF